MTRVETSWWGLSNVPPAPGDRVENVRTGEVVTVWLAVQVGLGWSMYVERA